MEMEMELKTKLMIGHQFKSTTEGKFRLLNETRKVLNVPRDLHILEIQPTEEITLNEIVFDSTSYMENETTKDDENLLVQKGIENAAKIDISRVPPKLQNKVKEAHLKYSNVFIPDLTQGYNGHSGKHSVRLQFADENRPMMNKCKIPK